MGRKKIEISKRCSECDGWEPFTTDPGDGGICSATGDFTWGTYGDRCRIYIPLSDDGGTSDGQRQAG